MSEGHSPASSVRGLVTFMSPPAAAGPGGRETGSVGRSVGGEQPPGSQRLQVRPSACRAHESVCGYHPLGSLSHWAILATESLQWTDPHKA